MEGLIDEEEDLIFEIELELFSIGTITLSKETISLLNVGVLEIKNIEKIWSRAHDIRLNNYKSGTFNSEIKRLVC